MAHRILATLLFLVFSTGSRAQWIQQSSPVSTNLHGVWFTSSSEGWIVGQSGTLLHTTNGGGAWSIQAVPTSENLNKIAFADPQHGYVVGDGNTIFATNDAGATWTQIYDGNPNFSNYYGLTISKDASRAWVSGGWQSNGQSSILRMRLGYTSPQLKGSGGRLVGVSLAGGDTGWVVGMNRTIMRTTDGGQVWTAQAGDPGTGYTGLNGVKCFDAQSGVAVGDSGVILRTTDGGANWQTVRKNDEVLFGAEIRRDSTAYVVGSANAVLKSTDCGATWTPQATPLVSATTLQQSFFIDDQRGWIVGTGGTILYTANGGTTAVEAGRGDSPGAFSLKANFPNPFNPSTTFEFDLPHAGHVTMKIFDVAGREVETLIDGMVEAGRSSRAWNANRFASGVYFCRMVFNDAGSIRAAEQKVVLVR